MPKRRNCDIGFVVRNASPTFVGCILIEWGTFRPERIQVHPAVNARSELQGLLCSFSPNLSAQARAKLSLPIYRI